MLDKEGNEKKLNILCNNDDYHVNEDKKYNTQDIIDKHFSCDDIKNNDVRFVSDTRLNKLPDDKLNEHITTYCSDSDNREKEEKKCSTSKKKCSDDKLENLRSVSHSLLPYTKDWDRESHTANKEDTCFPLNNDITKCKDQLLDIYSDLNSNVLKKLTKMFLTVRPINIVTDVDKGRFIEVLFAVSKDDERLKNSSKIFKQIIDNDEINYVEPLCEEEPNCIYHNFIDKDILSRVIRNYFNC